MAAMVLFMCVFAVLDSIIATSQPGPVGCEYKGELYEPGEVIMMDCNTCVCGESGLASCTMMDCQKSHKAVCEYKGSMYYEGSMFPDDCNSCTCLNNGQVICTLMACMENEVKRDTGVCEYNGEIYESGDHFMEDCNTCFCGDNGITGCTKMVCSSHKSGVCNYKDSVYKVDQVFLDDCNTCSCHSNGQVACTKIACNQGRDKRTSVPYLEGKCWYNGVFYDIGHTFKDSEDCNTCFCAGEGLKTFIGCTLMACQQTPIH